MTARVMVWYDENGFPFIASSEGVEIVSVDSKIHVGHPERVYVSGGTFTIPDLDDLIDRAIAGEDMSRLGGGGLKP